MRFLTAVYGKQYHELKKRGKITDHGRLYGNLFLSAIGITALALIVIVLSLFFEDWAKDAADELKDCFGVTEGKYIGRLLAIPFMLVLYGLTALLFGRKSQYEKHCRAFEAASETEKNAAAQKMLTPLYILAACLFIVSMSSLFL